VTPERGLDIKSRIDQGFDQFSLDEAKGGFRRHDIPACPPGFSMLEQEFAEAYFNEKGEKCVASHQGRRRRDASEAKDLGVDFEALGQRVVMRNEAFEKAYCDAREVLYSRGKKVGSPLLGPDYLRYCSVDGLLFNDHDVLKEAWDEKLADEILMALADGEFLPKCCPEGILLWLQYAAATRHNLQILVEQQTAARKLDSRTFTALAPELKQATEFRRQSRQSQLDHAAMHACRSA
jgi:hypothetical protein